MAVLARLVYWHQPKHRHYCYHVLLRRWFTDHHHHNKEGLLPVLRLLWTSFGQRGGDQSCFMKKKTKQEKRQDRYNHRRQRLRERSKATRQRKGDMLRNMPPDEAQQLVEERRRLKRERHEKMQQIFAIDQEFLAGRTPLPQHLRIAIDLGVGESVNDERSLRSLGLQLMYGWSWIKTAPTLESTAILHLFGYQGKVQELLDYQGLCHWPVHRHPGSPIDVFPPDRLIYLSPDSDNVLQELDLGKCYVIGGIVDRTIRNHLSLQRAMAQGIQTARLPLDEHIQMKKNKNHKVLNVDSVIQALVKYRELGDWSQALQLAICSRKKEIGDPGTTTSLPA